MRIEVTISVDFDEATTEGLTPGEIADNIEANAGTAIGDGLLTRAQDHLCIDDVRVTTSYGSNR